LHRNHTKEDALHALERCLDIFDKTTVDLIYGRHKDQSLSEWEEELSSLIKYPNLGHISLYQLTIEPSIHKTLNQSSLIHIGTPFYRKSQQDVSSVGVMWNDELSNQFYQQSIQVLKRGGFFQYEISNFTRSENHKSFHNDGYWKGLNYIGLGPGASGRLSSWSSAPVKHFETKNELHPTKWMQQVKEKGHGFMEFSQLTIEQKIQEHLLLGLRRVDGIFSEEFWRQTGYHLTQVLNPVQVEYWVKEGVLEFSEKSLKVKQEKLGILDTVLSSLDIKIKQSL
jgi:coproporphyrinogen III oxidase-like Fe-S oxidoreductase